MGGRERRGRSQLLRFRHKLAFPTRPLSSRWLSTASLGHPSLLVIQVYLFRPQSSSIKSILVLNPNESGNFPRCPPTILTLSEAITAFPVEPDEPSPQGGPPVHSKRALHYFFHKVSSLFLPINTPNTLHNSKYVTPIISARHRLEIAD